MAQVQTLQLHFTTGLATGGWYHIAAASNGTTLKIYVDGIAASQTATLGTSTQANAPISIGVPGLATNPATYNGLNGYIQDFRIYKGVAKYTGNFNPPSSTANATIGAGNDSLVDTPTSYGTDTGAGGEVRGNYATLNNLLNTSGSYANGNLERTQSDNFGALSTICPSSGKWYAEFVYTVIGSAGVGAIVCNRLASDGANGLGQTWQLGSDHRGFLYNAGSSTSVSTYTTNDVIGLAFDCSTGAASFYKNGSLLGTITNAAFANVPVGIGVATGGAAGSNTVVANYGQRAFAYPLSGFKALCDTNLGAPVVAKPNTVMDVVTRAGGGTTQTFATLRPGLVWEKRRDSSSNHYLFDVNRGNDNYLSSNLTSAEAASAGAFTFNTNSYTVSSGFDWPGGATVVDWVWDAGTSTVSNTAGSITSQVRANASAGFSIATLTTQSSGTGTFGHGLNAAPAFYIVKTRGISSNWWCYHSSLSTSQSSAIALNLTKRNSGLHEPLE